MIKRLLHVFLLILLAALLGAIVGGASAGFLHFIEWGQHWLWNELSAGLPLQALFLGVAGGLLVGLCQRYLGDHPPSITEAVAELRETGRLDYHHLPHGLMTAVSSLLFGASLGPEAPITDLVGGLSTWVGDVIRAWRTRLELPQLAETTNRWRRILQKWPNLIALGVGVLVFLRLLNGLYGEGLLRPAEPFQWNYLLWSVPLSLVGIAGGRLFLWLQTWTPRVVAPLRPYLVWRAVLGGLALGITAVFLPLVLFSGQHAIQPAYEQATELGFAVLALTGLARLFLVSLLLATGWKGGQFLPLMFGGAALGLAVSVLFPGIPGTVAALAAMAALTAVVLPKPIIALILMALMFPWQYVGVSVVAVGVVVIGQSLAGVAAGKTRTAVKLPAASD